MQLCDQLTLHGSATATQLAERLGESSGATSYHLRQLEKFGFVEEDRGRGTGRERFWRRVPGGITIDGPELGDSPATRDATRLVLNELNRARLARIEQWRDSYDRWPREWADASLEASSHLRLTAAELVQLNDEVDAVVTAWVERTRDRVGDEVADVEVQLYTYPVGEPPVSGLDGESARSSSPHPPAKTTRPTNPSAP